MTTIIVPLWEFVYAPGDPVGEPDWLDDRDVIPDARYTETLSMIDTRQRLPEAIHDRKLFIVTGIPGTGKSFGLRALTMKSPVRVVFCESRHGATMLSITRTVLEALGVPYGTHRSRDDLTDLLLDHLRSLDRRVVVMIDECQRMRTDAVDHIRYVHENSPNGCFGFIGGYGALEALEADPHLDRRALHRFDFPTLGLKASRTYARDYHELWAAAADRELSAVDRVYCKGRIGYWANATLVGLRLRHRKGAEFSGVDEDYVQELLIDLDKVDHLDEDDEHPEADDVNDRS